MYAKTEKKRRRFEAGPDRVDRHVTQLPPFESGERPAPSQNA